MNRTGETVEEDNQDMGVINDIPESGGSVAEEERRTQQLANAAVLDLSDRETGGLNIKEILILVVHDHAESVALMSFDLQKQGYRVITGSNGVEAVKLASMMRPNLILMDISMPELDGLGATVKIREDEQLRAVPVIAVTALTTAGFRRAAYDVGFDGYVTKPVDFQQLHELIIRLLSKANEEKAQAPITE